MTDYASFKHGAVLYPLPAVGSGIGGEGASFLRDADPALFFVLEFYKSVITTHLQTRFLEEVDAAGFSDAVSVAVAETLPMNPEPFLTQEHIRFPLLAAYRKGSRMESTGSYKLTADELEVSYVLPPTQAGEAERLLPMLKAVASVIDSRTEQGMDPAYTPTGSTAGAHVWELAGVARAEVKSAMFGSYMASDDLFFPCVVLKLELQERFDYDVEEFLELDVASANIDLDSPNEDKITDFVQIEIEA